jgi:hypothetical protein
MKRLLFIAVPLMLAACSSKDEQFCKCLNAGEELNDYSAKMLTEEVTKEKANKMQQLKEAKKKECVDYQTMMGDEMLKRKAECKN